MTNKKSSYEIIGCEGCFAHHTPDVLPKQSKRKLRKRGVVQKNNTGNPITLQGDTVRGSLHKETFYGAIKRRLPDKNGETQETVKYVVRKPLDALDDSNLKNIVDDHVRNIIIQARNKEKTLKKILEKLNKSLQDAEEDQEPLIYKEIEEVKKDIANLYAMPNKNGDPVPIKKVRVYQGDVTNPIHLKPHRDVSHHEHKSHYFVKNDGNYCMAIYEGRDKKGKIKRDFEIVSNLKAGEHVKLSMRKVLRPQGIGLYEGLFPATKNSGNVEMPLKAVIKTGTMVILWEKSPDEVWELDSKLIYNRLYKVTKLNKDGRITFKHHQEARNDEMLKTSYIEKFGVQPPKSLVNGESRIDLGSLIPKYLLSKGNFNFLIENKDFIITALGQIKKISL